LFEEITLDEAVAYMKRAVEKRTQQE